MGCGTGAGAGSATGTGSEAGTELLVGGSGNEACWGR